MSASVSDPRRWTPEEVEAIVRQHASRPGALLPILNAVQAAFGHVPAGAVPIVAQALNLSRAEVHGVVSFYHDYKSAPAERPVVKLCRAEACQARGVDRVAPLIEQDGRVQLETVYCLGLCASGPAAMVGERLFGRLVDADGARRLVDAALRSAA